MIDKIAPAGAAIRGDLSAQEAERAAATRATEDARRGTATEARAALGLEDLAGEYAGGDVVTEQSDAMVTDAEAQRVAAENTLLANEAIAQQQGDNQRIGYGLREEDSERALQTSLEDALAAIRAERAGVVAARAQAAAASRGSGPDIGGALAIFDRIQQQVNPQASGEPSPLQIFQRNNPSLANSAQQAADTFSQWIATNYNKIPAVQSSSSGTATSGAIVNSFLDSISATVPQAQSWAGNSAMYNWLLQLATPPAR